MAKGKIFSDCMASEDFEYSILYLPLLIILSFTSKHLLLFFLCNFAFNLCVNYSFKHIHKCVHIKPSNKNIPGHMVHMDVWFSRWWCCKNNSNLKCQIHKNFSDLSSMAIIKGGSRRIGMGSTTRVRDVSIKAWTKRHLSEQMSLSFHLTHAK